jgi:hypothetical protein
VTVTAGGEVSTGAAVIVDWDDQNREPEEYFVIKTGPGDGDDPGGGPGDGDDPGDGTGGGDPSEIVQYFVETMGILGQSQEPVKIADYRGWKNPAPTFTDRFGNADVRRHGSLDAHIWFPPGVNCEVVIGGLPEGYSDVTLAYDITCDPENVTGTVRADVIRVFAGDENLTPWVTRNITSPGRYTRIVTGTLRSGATTLRFQSDGAVNRYGIRIDNITLEGVEN